MSNLIQVNNNSLEAREINSSLMQDFIAYLDVSDKTIKTYTKALRQLNKYLATNDIKNPTRADILAFKQHLIDKGLKPATVQNYIISARQFFKWTELQGIYPNIAKNIKGAKIDKGHKKDYLTSNQVKHLLGNIDTSDLKGIRDYAIIALMVTAGLRTIEVSRANVEDLRPLGNGTVLYIQGKGKADKTDYVKVSEPVERILRAYLATRELEDNKEPLFVSTSNNSLNKRLTTRSISGIVKDSLINAGYDSDRITAHSLRHTAVTLSLLAGEEITAVQQFARHASINTTMIYNHALDKAKNSCSESISNSIFN